MVQHNSLSTSKQTKWPMRPPKTQISMGIHSVWSESSLSARRSIGTAKTLIRLGVAQAVLRLRRALMSFCWFCHAAAWKYTRGVLFVNSRWGVYFHVYPVLVKADGTATDCSSSNSNCPASATCATSICNCDAGWIHDGNGLCTGKKA